MSRRALVLALGAMLILSPIIKIFVFGFIDPADKNDPGFWWEVYNLSALLWIPGVVLLIWGVSMRRSRRR